MVYRLMGFGWALISIVSILAGDPADEHLLRAILSMLCFIAAEIEDK